MKRTRLKRVGKAKVRSRLKFKNVPLTYKGELYHSRLEANYAALLDLRMKASSAVDRIRGWRRQVPIKLEVNGALICTYICDFEVEHMDGRLELVECKGYETETWKIKEKLVRALHPERKLTIVRHA